MIDYKEFEEELEDLAEVTKDAIKEILLSIDRVSKHPPYTWMEEEEDEHLRKAARHILTYQLIRDHQQDSDGENHLHLAICRLAMALGRIH